MKLRNSICWLVYHLELGPLGNVLLDFAFARRRAVFPNHFRDWGASNARNCSLATRCAHFNYHSALSIQRAL